MQVRVQVHQRARPDFERWVRSLGRDHQEQLLFADTYFYEMVSQFRKYVGRPPGSKRFAPTIESVFVWE